MPYFLLYHTSYLGYGTFVSNIVLFASLADGFCADCIMIIVKIICKDEYKMKKIWRKGNNSIIYSIIADNPQSLTNRCNLHHGLDHITVKHSEKFTLQSKYNDNFIQSIKKYFAHMLQKCGTKLEWQSKGFQFFTSIFFTIN